MDFVYDDIKMNLNYNTLGDVMVKILNEKDKSII